MKTTITTKQCASWGGGDAINEWTSTHKLKSKEKRSCEDEDDATPDIIGLPYNASK